MTDSKIERYEWDFDSCPADQLELCFEYERARSSADQHEIKEAESWRSMFPGKTFDDYWKHVAPSNDYTSDGHGTAPMSAVHFCPEFPTKPYLTISGLERNRRFALMQGQGIYPVGAEDEKLSKEFRNKHGGRDWSWVEQGFHDLRSYFWIDVSKSSGVTHHDEPYVIDGNAIKCPRMTFGLFRFDWSCNDQVFIDALRAWLDKNRDRTVKIRDARGGGSESRRFRSLLNKLGAWRLLNFPMTWQKAASHTQLEREDHKSLYSEQPAWIRARNEADRFLGMSNR